MTYSRGEAWSTDDNQPTAQFYRVSTDDHFPYRIYGAQQDNSTVRILHRSSRGSIGPRDWEPTAGGESGYIAPDPNDPDIVYGGSYGGYLTRINHRTGEQRNIHIWPDNPMGHGAGDGKYRFQWNFPIFFSRHDPKTLFAAGNVLFKTSDGGESWTKISDDLTRNDPSKLGSSGGPITKDNTSVEYYCTIFSAVESLYEKDVIWVGSDDGLIQITRDGGNKWENVTPPDMPEWMQINSIEPHPTEKGGLYVAGTRYKLDDFKPYLYRTTDYGKTWTRIDTGIDRKHFTRVVRADPKRQGLLFAGTESGLYISWNDGESWKPFQCNLPVVPVTDLALKNDDLIVATQGRSFWVLDDVTQLHQWTSEVLASQFHLFQTRPTYRIPGGGGSSSRTSGQNISAGVPLRYHVSEELGDGKLAALVITDSDGRHVVTFSTKPDKEKKERQLKFNKGLNTIDWDMRVNAAESFDGVVLWGGGLEGPRVVPGTYSAKLSVGDEPQEVKFDILGDPRSSSNLDDLKAQYEFLVQVRDKLTETHNAVTRLRDVKSQIQALSGRLEKSGDYKSLVDDGKQITERLTAIEQNLYQTQNQSSQDPLNYPIRLNNRLSALVDVVGTGDYPPTRQAIEVRDILVAEINEQLSGLSKLLDEDLNRFNAKVRAENIPAIFVDLTGK